MSTPTPDAKVIAIIPARGGSKRIPRKNIKPFAGKPIIAYSIAAALESGCFDEVMVSTEDHEIADVARAHGASIPFLRSPETADDMSMLADVIREVLLTYADRGETVTHCCCLLPTAPFIRPERLRQGHELLMRTGADTIVPITRFSYPIQRAVKVVPPTAEHPHDTMAMFWPENYNVRSQDLEPAYHDCGQFYWMRADSIVEQMQLFARHTVPLEIPEREVQDIDTEEDWVLAEWKFAAMQRSPVGVG